MGFKFHVLFRSHFQAAAGDYYDRDRYDDRDRYESRDRYDDRGSFDEARVEIEWQHADFAGASARGELFRGRMSLLCLGGKMFDVYGMSLHVRHHASRSLEYVTALANLIYGACRTSSVRQRLSGGTLRL